MNRQTAVRILLLVMLAVPLRTKAEPLPLGSVVTPSTVIEKNGEPVMFAIHGYVEFKSLKDAFQYIEAQKRRWHGRISEEDERQLGLSLVREAVESRVVSMSDERPLEALVTHTAEELKAIIAEVKEPVPAGYEGAFLAVQAKWKHSLNCWSASPSIAGRVLSNWYPIEEGIELHGAVYNSTEHFWQAVKYHPETTIRDLDALLDEFGKQDWSAWLKRLDEDPKLYPPNAYAIEFLRFNLTRAQLRWFREQLSSHGLQAEDHVRKIQERGSMPPRFTALEEKVVWGDLADLFHLVYVLSTPGESLRARLEAAHFDGIYLDGRKMGFLSEEFRRQMLEIWKVKYLRIPRFREVIAGIPEEIRLEHFLNDGDSPDIPIPIYVNYLNRIREMARAQKLN